MGDNIPQPQVMSIRDALRLADEMELDLIEISPKAEPPVCRIADYQKFLYQQKKKAKELKANQTKVVVKEIRFGPHYVDFPSRPLLYIPIQIVCIHCIVHKNTSCHWCYMYMQEARNYELT